MSMAIVEKDLGYFISPLWYQDCVSVSATGAATLQQSFIAHSDNLGLRNYRKRKKWMDESNFG
jgi:hypothetical protein